MKNELVIAALVFVLVTASMLLGMLIGAAS